MPSALRSWKSWLFLLASAGLLWGETAWCVDKIRLGLSTRNVVLMPFYYARDKKLFDKYGLDVEIIQIRSNLQLAGLIAGELDFITGRRLTLANDHYRPRLSSRPHVENDIDAVALGIDDIIFGMPSGRAFSLMDGSDGVDRIERGNQKTKMPDAVRLIAFACVDGEMHEAIGHVNAALVAARVSPDNPQAEGFFVKRAELVRILRAYGDVSDLHFIRHKLLLSGRCRGH